MKIKNSLGDDSKQKTQGFTLIELVITITLSGFLLAVVSLFMTYPILAYSDVRHRADLLDSAEMAFERMRADLQRALPNSIRVKQDPNNANRIALEFMNVVESIRYRATSPNPFLDFTGSGSTQFDTIGLFNTAPTNATCVANDCRLVVYNAGVYGVDTDHPSDGLNAYSTATTVAGAVTITPPNTSVSFSTNGNESQLTLNSAVLFANISPAQRLYVVDTPVSYVCDLSNGQKRLTRYWDYAITAVQATDPSQDIFANARTAPLANHVSSCAFSYTPGTASVYGMVNLTLSFTRGGETITLMREITVENDL